MDSSNGRCEPESRATYGKAGPWSEERRWALARSTCARKGYSSVGRIPEGRGERFRESEVNVSSAEGEIEPLRSSLRSCMRSTRTSMRVK